MSSQDSELQMTNIKFIPVKMKDFVKILQKDDSYIGKIKIEKRNVSPTELITPLESLSLSPQSPMRTRSPEQISTSRKAKRSPINLENNIPKHYENLATNKQVFAMPDVQAYPVIGCSGFRAGSTKRQRGKQSNKLKRSQSRRRSPSKTRSRSRTQKKMREPSMKKSHSKSRVYKHRETSNKRSRSKSELQRKWRACSLSRSPNNSKKHKNRRAFSKSRSRSETRLRDKSRGQPPTHQQLIKPSTLHDRTLHHRNEHDLNSKLRPSRKRSPMVIERKRVSDQPEKRNIPHCTTIYDDECMCSLPKSVYIAYKRPSYRGTRCAAQQPECGPCVEQCKSLEMLNVDGRMFHIYPCESHENLTFIQPGLCSKKDYLWTNEYAVIPKPQVHLIDPSVDLDPKIHPIANRPCIRDKAGNPLTDCIGRPLRDPTGKRYLKFNPNGSIMDINIEGKFYTGQPPLCLKQSFPNCSCAPANTDNRQLDCWLSGGNLNDSDINRFFRKLKQVKDHWS